jgi:hypothetical protein
MASTAPRVQKWSAAICPSRNPNMLALSISTGAPLSFPIPVWRAITTRCLLPIGSTSVGVAL